MKSDWMAKLASHYSRTRQRYPDDRLMILFDVDGTILDMRYMVLYTLHAYDRAHKTRFFRKLTVDEIKVHENEVESLLAGMEVPADQRDSVLDWYNQNRWTSEYIFHSHHPFAGVLEVIRWFQLQPNTFVGLNTGRPESIREDTLKSLNRLGEEFKVEFREDLLYMNPLDWEQEIPSTKVEGVRHFQSAGYRIFAFVDNEPGNLKAVAKIDHGQEILLLHAQTIFRSKRVRLPSHAAKGRKYDLTELIPEKALPAHVQFVWHGINDEANLRQFLASDITWGECDARLDPIGSDIILRHDSFADAPLNEDEQMFGFEHLLAALREHGKRIKIDLKSGGILVDKVLESLRSFGLEDESLWFNGNVERLHERGFQKLAQAHPSAVRQCPVDFLAPLIRSAPAKAKEVLDMFGGWGINRFSIDWQSQDLRAFVEQMDNWGFEVNIYNVPDLESFLQAVLLTPRAITSDFNFPKWHYFGRGSGENGGHYEYDIRKRRGRR